MKLLDKIRKLFFEKELTETVKSETNYDFQRLETKNQLAALGSISASIEHDLKTPLANLRTDMLHLRKMLINNERAQTVLARMDHSINRIYACAKIVPILRSHGNTQYDDLLNKKINVIDLINTCIREIKQELNLDNEKFFFRINFNDADFFVKGYFEMLASAIVNILKNAIEAIYETGKSKGVIEINLLKDLSSPDFIRIDIVDEGIGIPVENIGKLTGIFTTKNKVNGGIGLFITDKIIKVHNGEIKIKSELGKGTVVSINLPSYKAKIEIEKENDFLD